MSKLKNPRAKKTASLAHDHRSAEGKTSKAARKSIPRAKARSERVLRRAVHQALAHAEPLVSDTEVELAENKLTNAAGVRQSKGFKKKPGVPLGEYLAGKGRRRAG